MILRTTGPFLLCCTAKLLESIIAYKLTNHLVKSKFVITKCSDIRSDLEMYEILELN